MCGLLSLGSSICISRSGLQLSLTMAGWCVFPIMPRALLGRLHTIVLLILVLSLTIHLAG